MFAGLAVAAAVLWAAVNELLIQPVEYTCYNLALEKARCRWHRYHPSLTSTPRQHSERGLCLRDRRAPPSTQHLQRKPTLQSNIPTWACADGSEASPTMVPVHRLQSSILCQAR